MTEGATEVLVQKGASSMTTTYKVGDRARFTGHDKVFHEGQREGKVGMIVTDATLDENGSNFGIMPPLSNGTCGWQLDGQESVFITALDDLTPCAKDERCQP